MFNIIWWIISGFIIGLIARALLPGAQHMGFILTTLLGIAGSLVGGVVGALLWRRPEGARFHRAGFILSVICAIIVLYLWQRFGR